MGLLSTLRNIGQGIMTFGLPTMSLRGMMMGALSPMIAQMPLLNKALSGVKASQFLATLRRTAQNLLFNPLVLRIPGGVRAASTFLGAVNSTSVLANLASTGEFFPNAIDGSRSNWAQMIAAQHGNIARSQET